MNIPTPAIGTNAVSAWCNIPLKCGSIAIGLLVLVLGGCDQAPPASAPAVPKIPSVRIDKRSYEEKIGSYFVVKPPGKLTAVRAHEIAFTSAGGDSIWGALGVTGTGDVWFGISGSGTVGGQLMQIQNPSSTVMARGAVVQQTEAAVDAENLGGQQKIHSRIRQAVDGYLYFATTNETDEDWQVDRLPRYGSYLWRVKPEGSAWEHVVSSPEALIAIETIGRYVYALGYWGHVLYQFDTATDGVEKLIVGADCGHVSRNFFVDIRGRVFVPRLRKRLLNQPCSHDNVIVNLLEISERLEIMAEHEIPDYLGGNSPHSSQGITAFAYREDQSLIFSTKRGDLFHVISHGDEPALVLQLGNIDPHTSVSVTNLLSIDGRSQIGSVVQHDFGDRQPQLAWLQHDIQTSTAYYTPIETDASSPLADARALLLYGTGIRNADGRTFVGGRVQNQQGEILPLLLELQFAYTEQ